MNDLKVLAKNDLLSKAVIYRELESLFIINDNEQDILNIINICYEIYLKREFATLIGIAQCAMNYINDLRKNGISISDFEYDKLFLKYHLDNELYY